MTEEEKHTYSRVAKILKSVSYEDLEETERPCPIHFEFDAILSKTIFEKSFRIQLNRMEKLVKMSLKRKPQL